MHESQPKIEEPAFINPIAKEFYDSQIKEHHYVYSFYESIADNLDGFPNTKIIVETLHEQYDAKWASFVQILNYIETVPSYYEHNKSILLATNNLLKARTIFIQEIENAEQIIAINSNAVLGIRGLIRVVFKRNKS